MRKTISLILMLLMVLGSINIVFASETTINENLSNEQLSKDKQLIKSASDVQFTNNYLSKMAFYDTLDLS
ncbi:hypothetical protein [Anaerovorax odorimutans]|uniref:hypothetical protein n=1 Tax=Anaerovorax odorimutans TaxID=109327 RepID=UPI000421125C|nr:hypothetical protein [Anaerovorax odorimutans]